MLLPLQSAAVLGSVDPKVGFPWSWRIWYR